MNKKTMGFIGGGRVTRIILGGLKRAGMLPEEVFVSDTNADILENLKKDFGMINIALNDNNKPVSCDMVFLSIHPPVIGDVLKSIKPSIRQDAVLVSLAPKLAIAKITELLGGFQRIVRMIPNAPSIINKGYNPVVFSKAITASEKEALITLFTILGDCPEVAEKDLEAYAILTAMGPTYLWFQLYELQRIALSFGLTDVAVVEGIEKMVTGAIAMMYESELTPEEVMNLIPVKPLGEDEEKIKEIYQARLSALFAKLKS